MELRKEWTSLFPGAPFDYFFLNEFFDTFYKEERQFAGVFGFFAIVGIMITCMGLFGLNLYNINTRSKEIGVRKTMGASVFSLMWLFASDYLKLLLAAALMSIPFGLWSVNSWLQNYPSRISLGLDTVMVPLASAMLISALTVIYHTYRTANSNPVKALRSK
ncbi:FtsX-like permease family protein [Chryseolinea sp. T2]|uniref:ABC transporter permease n=1 Tax=Chryseolinea sp. T2 TaxID=3129255 RepID=UPI0030780D85